MMKLLVVDDSEPIRSRLVKWLQGILGLEAIGTAATLAIPGRHLLDGDTAQILHRLKQLEPSMQIAMLTNDASNDNRGKRLGAGASWFFDKSTELEKVLAFVQQQVALH